MRLSALSDMTRDGFKGGGEIEQNLFNLSAGEKRKYLFLKQIATLNSFRERNAISKEQYEMSYWWIEEIDDPETVRKIKSLSESDLEVLTLMVIDELKSKEIAQVTGIPLRTIERKKARFKNLFKKF